MTLAYAAATRNNRLQQVIDAIDAGAAAGKLRIYDGTRPASGGAATTLLSEHTLSDPCGTKAGGVLTFSAIGDATIAASGTATWFRIVDSDGNFVVDGDVSTSGGGGDLIVDSAAFASGATASITSLTITEGNA